VKALERRLGLTGVLAISISAMLGSGIFVLPGLAAGMTGPSVWLAYLVAGLCVLPAALAKAELATAMPTSGGSYVYIERTFGPLAGTVAGLGLWLSLLLKSAFALVGFGAYLSMITDLPLKAAAFALLIAIVVLNVLGVKTIGRLQKLVLTTVVVGLAILTYMGISAFKPELLVPAFTKETQGFIAAVAFVYVSYAGVTKVGAIAEEVKNPGRNLPLGILLSLAIVMGIYAVVVFLLVGIVPAEKLGDDLHPIYTMAVAIGGGNMGLIAAIIAVITMTSMGLAGLMAASRFPFAMSRDDLLPGSIQRISSQFKTPVTAIILTASVMAFVILFLPVAQIAKLASSFKILIFMVINATLIVLRQSAPQWYQPSYKSPLYPSIQIMGILLSLVLLFSMGLTGLSAAFAIIAGGTVFYMLYGRKRTSRRGVVGRFQSRMDLLNQEPAGELDEQLPVSAEVVVPLFGRARSPETLVEMGAALADGKKIDVLHVTEIPEQSFLTDFLQDDVQTTAIQRRIMAMAEEENLDLTFNTTVSRDVGRTVHHVTNRLECEWVVMEWDGHRATDLFRSHPMGWIQDHLSCNLAVFKDAGVRFIRQILVYVETGPHDTLVVRTADHLATTYGAELNFLCFIPDDVIPTTAQAHADYIDQICQMARAPHRAVSVRGTDELRAVREASAAYDLLVMGAPSSRNFWSRFRGSEKDRLTEGAASSVLWLKTPREQVHGAFLPSGEESFDLLRFLEPRCIRAHVEGVRKESLFALIARDFENIIPEAKRGEIRKALWEREALQNTSVGGGIAMPHATLTSATRSYLGIYVTAKAIDYQAPDAQPVDIFFVTLGPPADRQIHLLLLAAVSNLALNTGLIEALRDGLKVADVLTAVETALKKLAELDKEPLG
jgi:APA family basic amino acid/polyamine antiporter